jgi:hypothetical protein
MSAAGRGQQTDVQRAAVKVKMDALRSWATTNNVDMQYAGPGGRGGGHGGPGGPDGGTPPSDSSN